MEEHQVNRKRAFRLMEWALAKLAREEGQTVSIVAQADDDDQDYGDEEDDGDAPPPLEE